METTTGQPRKLRIVRKTQPQKAIKEDPPKEDKDKEQKCEDPIQKPAEETSKPPPAKVDTPKRKSTPQSEKERAERKAEREQKARERQKEKDEITKKAATGCRGVEITYKKEEEKEVMERKLLLKLKPYRNHGFRVNWVSPTVAVVLFRTYFYGILIFVLISPSYFSRFLYS